jgi:glycerate 2-kinase
MIPDRTDQDLPELARRMAAVALAAVDPEQLVRDALAARAAHGVSCGAVVAVGKAAAGMARGTRGALAPGERRLLVRPHSSPGLLDPAWEQWSGGHPTLDRQSVAAGARVRAWLAELPPAGTGAPMLALISGGSSACLELPAGDLTLAELAATQRALLASGLPIGAFNTVRKHLSLLKGGGALRLTRARVVALLISDVPGDDPGTIGSGPFTADPTTFAEALAAVAGLQVPERVRAFLAAGARGELPETLKPGDPDLERVDAAVIGSVAQAGAAALAEAVRRGFTAAPGFRLEGEAAAVAGRLVRAGRAAPGDKVALVVGGETTVTLGAEEGGPGGGPGPSGGAGGRSGSGSGEQGASRGSGPSGGAGGRPGSGSGERGASRPGLGGRNQELALAAARELAGGRGELVLTLATDGEDGPTRYAGGVVGNATWAALERSGADPAGALLRHDSQRALAAQPGALLETGPTGTNVGDLAFYLRVGPPPG